MRGQQDQESRVFNELSALLFNLIRSPSPYQISDHSLALSPAASSRRRRSAFPPQISPSGFAALLLGVSVSMMLCGSVTFFIGFLMMPWVIGLVFFFYVVGIISTVSVLARTVLCHASAVVTPRKEVSAWKLM